ncbi:MAG: FMN-binding protein [Christensenellales bacterium]
MNKIKMLSLLAAAAMMTGSVAMAETYSATGNGYHGEMTVDVTIENGTITDVALGDNHETNVVIDRAFPVIRERILEANTADVDSVSAATFSSYAIKTAVADAMSRPVWKRRRLPCRMPRSRRPSARPRNATS